MLITTFKQLIGGEEENIKSNSASDLWKTFPWILSKLFSNRCQNQSRITFISFALHPAVIAIKIRIIFSAKNKNNYLCPIITNGFSRTLWRSIIQSRDLSRLGIELLSRNKWSSWFFWLASNFYQEFILKKHPPSVQNCRYWWVCRISQE